MGGSCSTEDIDAAAKKWCGEARDQWRQMRDHVSDLSTQVVGDQEHTSGGIRIVDMHGSSATTFFIGLGLGLFLGALVTAFFCRKMARPWRALARKQERHLQTSPMHLTRDLAKSRLAELSALGPSAADQPRTRTRRPSVDSAGETPATARRQMRAERADLRTTTDRLKAVTAAITEPARPLRPLQWAGQHEQVMPYQPPTAPPAATVNYYGTVQPAQQQPTQQQLLQQQPQVPQPQQHQQLPQQQQQLPTSSPHQGTPSPQVEPPTSPSDAQRPPFASAFRL